MFDAYSDITSRIPGPPRWFDLHGVPRYDEPHVPAHLMGRVRCQNCGRIFRVSLTDNIYHLAGHRNAGGALILGDANVEEDPEKTAQLVDPETGAVRQLRLKEFLSAEHLRLREDWHYGDPPDHGCVGDSMNSIPEHEWAEYFPEEEASS